GFRGHLLGRLAPDPSGQVRSRRGRASPRRAPSGRRSVSAGSAWSCSVRQGIVSGYSATVGIGAPTLAESAIVLAARLGRESQRLPSLFVERAGIVVVPFDSAH